MRADTKLMAIAAKGPWERSELEAIVADYLDMLQIELRGGTFNKAGRNRSLQRVTGRTHGSIEFKHRNISAVMAELGLPFVQGYIPAKNYQLALFRVIEGRLVQTGLHERLATEEPTGVIPSIGKIYQDVPAIQPKADRIDPEIRRIIKRFDPAERDARARALGKAGEEFLFRYERHYLSAIGRDDLSSRVRWVAEEEGDGAGYDILSFSGDGAERWLEVKTTNGPVTTPFWISENERRVAEENPDVFRLARLYDFSREPAAYRLKPPLSNHVKLVATEYKATLL